MIKSKIRVSRTGRYYLSAAPSSHIDEVWFVCHGYGQLAEYFIRNFQGLQKENVLVVAPEGLNRFYLNGFSGRVAASWMTKEDRLDEINDYVQFLDDVYTEVISQLHNKDLKISFFSQGTATVSRWFCQGQAKAENLVLWAGALPADQTKEDVEKLKGVKLYLVAGDNDPFITEDALQRELSLLHEKELEYDLIRFGGKHEIDPEALQVLAAKLRSV
ncbi:MAG TPA: hypothetical protein VF868_00450 [Bacteroidia bacterium]|jgi:predicted esterase